MDKEPMSDFMRYAFGYTDEKPWATIVIIVIMLVTLIGVALLS